MEAVKPTERARAVHAAMLKMLGEVELRDVLSSAGKGIELYDPEEADHVGGSFGTYRVVRNVDGWDGGKGEWVLMEGDCCVETGTFEDMIKNLLGTAIVNVDWAALLDEQQEKAVKQ